jgi:hypothetical protein
METIIKRGQLAFCKRGNMVTTFRHGHTRYIQKRHYNNCLSSTFLGHERDEVDEIIGRPGHYIWLCEYTRQTEYQQKIIAGLDTPDWKNT